MTQDWPHLLHCALLGTDKMPLREDLCPDYVAAYMEAHPALDSTQCIMSAVALQRTFSLAGRVPPSPTLPTTTAAPEEFRTTCSEASIRAWQQIRALNNPMLYLERYWLLLCAAEDKVLAPDILVSVLDLAADRRFMALRTDVVRVMSERGKWLSGFNPAWKYAKDPTPPDKPLPGGEAPLASTAFQRTINTNELRNDTGWHGEWSLSVSEHMLRCFFAEWNGYHFSNLKDWITLAVFLHPDVLPERTPSLDDPPRVRDYWLSKIVPELDRVCAVKRTLVSLKTKF
jgi:Family of unknown function (DUF5691)